MGVWPGRPGGARASRGIPGRHGCWNGCGHESTPEVGALVGSGPGAHPRRRGAGADAARDGALRRGGGGAGVSPVLRAVDTRLAGSVKAVSAPRTHPRRERCGLGLRLVAAPLRAVWCSVQRRTRQPAPRFRGTGRRASTRPHRGGGEDQQRSAGRRAVSGQDACPPACEGSRGLATQASRGLGTSKPRYLVLLQRRCPGDGRHRPGAWPTTARKSIDMVRLVRAVLTRLLPPTGTRRADSEHYAADEPTMALPRVPDPGPLVRPFFVAFEEGRR